MNIQAYLLEMEEKVESVERNGKRKQEVYDTVKALIEDKKPTFVSTIATQLVMKPQQVHSIVKAHKQLDKAKVNGRTLIVVVE